MTLLWFTFGSGILIVLGAHALRWWQLRHMTDEERVHYLASSRLHHMTEDDA